jgi:hypothetical protein
VLDNKQLRGINSTGDNNQRWSVKNRKDVAAFQYEAIRDRATTLDDKRPAILRGPLVRLAATIQLNALCNAQSGVRQVLLQEMLLRVNDKDSAHALGSVDLCCANVCDDEHDDFAYGDCCQLAQLWKPMAVGAQRNKDESMRLDVGDAHALLTSNAVSLACIAEQLLGIDGAVRNSELALAMCLDALQCSLVAFSFDAHRGQQMSSTTRRVLSDMQFLLHGSSLWSSKSVDGAPNLVVASLSAVSGVWRALELTSDDLRRCVNSADTAYVLRSANAAATQSSKATVIGKATAAAANVTNRGVGPTNACIVRNTNGFAMSLASSFSQLLRALVAVGVSSVARLDILSKRSSIVQQRQLSAHARATMQRAQRLMTCLNTGVSLAEVAQSYAHLVPLLLRVLAVECSAAVIVTQQLTSHVELEHLRVAQAAFRVVMIDGDATNDQDRLKLGDIIEVGAYLVDFIRC